jgi:hypothetical protein
MIYSAQFNKSMIQNRIKMLAAGGSGGRSEVRFFEASSVTESEPIGELSGGFRSTHHIDGFPGGVQSIDFSYKSNKLAVGTANGFVGSFRLRVSETMY